MANNKPLKGIWASESANILEQNIQEIKQGIGYQSIVRSDQLNGILNSLSNQIFFNQLNGLQYSDEITYFKGNYCSAIYTLSVTDLDITELNFGIFICVDDNNGAGLQKIKPVSGPAQYLNGTLILQGTSISEFWSLLKF